MSKSCTQPKRLSFTVLLCAVALSVACKKRERCDPALLSSALGGEASANSAAKAIRSACPAPRSPWLSWWLKSVAGPPGSAGGGSPTSKQSDDEELSRLWTLACPTSPSLKRTYSRFTEGGASNSVQAVLRDCDLGRFEVLDSREIEVLTDLGLFAWATFVWLRELGVGEELARETLRALLERSQFTPGMGEGAPLPELPAVDSRVRPSDTALLAIVKGGRVWIDDVDVGALDGPQVMSQVGQRVAKWKSRAAQLDAGPLVLQVAAERDARANSLTNLFELAQRAEFARVEVLVRTDHYLESFAAVPVRLAPPGSDAESSVTISVGESVGDFASRVASAQGQPCCDERHSAGCEQVCWTHVIDVRPAGTDQSSGAP